LTTRDRVGRNDFPMTQELLAVMLGVRRPSVTIAVNALQRAGLIEYRYKRLCIVDGPGLEAASCECYVVVRKSFTRLLA
jgi:Mn-dependent DtxR family transcriptional regulator